MNATILQDINKNLDEARACLGEIDRHLNCEGEDLNQEARELVKTKAGKIMELCENLIVSINKDA